MTRKRQISAVAGMLFIMLAFVIVGFSLFSNSEHPQTDEVLSETFSSKPDEEKDISPPQRYILKIEDGILCVFNEIDMTRPILVTDIYAGTLRHYDRKQLSDGVLAVGDFELQARLEDYSS